jgi:uncharacterized Ntn-hydrolase superfamily protein
MIRCLIAPILALNLAWPNMVMSEETPSEFYAPRDSTYSIIARDPETGLLGLGVQSRALSIGNRVVTAKGGVAIVAHQSSSNPMYGKLIIDGIERGMTPQQALEFALRADKEPNRRQVSVIDIKGRSASWTSQTIPDWKGHRCTDTYCVQGNTIASEEVINAMAKAYETSKGPMAERLLAALDAAEAAGGDRRGMQGAMLKVVKPLVRADFDDTLLDIRVDDHKQPLVELRRILGVTRAMETVGRIGPLIQKNDLDGAMKLAEAALVMSPEYDMALVAIADVNLRRGQKAEALKAIERAIASNPAQKGQLAQSKAFASLAGDPDFQRLTR